MKIDTTKSPWGNLRAVVKATWPYWIDNPSLVPFWDGVCFYPIGKVDSIQLAAGGKTLRVNVKNGEIDLDLLRSKHAELVTLLAEQDAERKADEAHLKQREAEFDALCDALNFARTRVQDVRVDGCMMVSHGKNYRIILDPLTAEQVRSVVPAIRQALGLEPTSSDCGGKKERQP